MIGHLQIIDFWFANKAKWFAKDPNFDLEIKEKFLAVFDLGISGHLKHWELNPSSMLALIIVLDQFSRNMFRDSAKAFSADELACSLAKKAVQLGFDQLLDNDEQRKFLYMPFMHSESVADQALSVALFSKMNDNETLKYAKAHQDIIDRFGRFPHRNQLLGRVSSTQELEFLKLPGTSF